MSLNEMRRVLRNYFQNFYLNLWCFQCHLTYQLVNKIPYKIFFYLFEDFASFCERMVILVTIYAALFVYWSVAFSIFMFCWLAQKTNGQFVAISCRVIKFFAFPTLNYNNCFWNLLSLRFIFSYWGKALVNMFWIDSILFAGIISSFPFLSKFIDFMLSGQVSSRCCLYLFKSSFFASKDTKIGFNLLVFLGVGLFVLFVSKRFISMRFDSKLFGSCGLFGLFLCVVSKCVCFLIVGGLVVHFNYFGDTFSFILCKRANLEWIWYSDLILVRIISFYWNNRICFFFLNYFLVSKYFDLVNFLFFYYY